MEDLFRDYWWLVFPLSGFVFAGFGMVMNYRMQRDRMDVLKTYADRGQTPPPELTEPMLDDPYAYGRYGRRAWRAQRRAMRGYYWSPRWAVMAPYWAWRRVIVTGCLAAAFLAAAFSYGDGHAHGAFLFVAIVMGAAFMGSLVMAVSFAGPRPYAGADVPPRVDPKAN